MSKKMRLKDLGCKDITLYNAVANYGYKFRKNNIKYDLRHILNDCGTQVDYYILNAVNVHKQFKSWEEVVDFIRREL